MLSDEEKKALKVVNKRTERLIEELKIEEEDLIDEPKIAYLITQIEANKTLVNLIEKQSKEIEELKEKCKSMIDPSKARLTYNKGGAMVVLEGFISKKKSEQKEKEAWIEGTNVAHNLCNKKWEDKIKAEIEELEKQDRENRMSCNYLVIPVLHSLLEKE